MSFLKSSLNLVFIIIMCGIGSLSAQVTIGNLPATLEFCEGDTLLETLSPPSVSGTYIAGSGVWTIDKVVIPNDYIVSYYDTARILYYRISILAGTASIDTAYLYSAGQKLTVKDAPELTRLNLENKPCVGDTIGAKVETNESSPTYQWFLDNLPITNAITDSLVHELDASDIGKTLSVEVTGPNGCASKLQTVLTSAAGSVTLPRSLDVGPTDFTDFPVTTGLDFEDPVIDYTSSSSYLFLTYDSQNYVNGEVKSIYVPYLGDNFTCSVALLNPGDLVPATLFDSNRTVFLDNAEFTFTACAPYSPFELHDDIRMIGVDTAANGFPQTIIIPYLEGGSGNDGYRFRFTRMNCILQNVIIDGDRQAFHNYFIHVQYGTDGLLMKDVRIRNVGFSSGLFSLQRGIFNIFQGDLREPNAKRYFINVTVENSIMVSSMYDLINISTADGVYFRNLDIQTTAGYYSIVVAHGSNGYVDNTGGKNIIFAGTLKLPAEVNQIGILRYSSRKISFPKEFRYARIRYNWSETGTSTSGSAIFLSNTFIPNTNPNTNYVLLDMEEDAFIINTALSTNFNTQLTRLQSLYNHASTNANCNLPDPINIKIAPFPSGNIIIPDFGEKITNILFTETTGTSIATTDLISYADSAQTITTASSANIDYVRIHNLDFHTPLKRTLTSVNGLFPSGTTPGIFQNCKFSGMETAVENADMVITANPVMEATFTEDGQVINVDSEVGTTLHIEVEGIFPMDVIYAINGVDQPAATLNSSPYDVVVPTGLATGTYTYILKEIVGGGSACSQASGEVIIHVFNCDDATYTLACSPIIVELAYGEHSRIIDLDTPTVAKPARLNVTLTSNAPGKIVNLSAGVYSYEWTGTDDCDPLRKVKCIQYVIVNHSPCGNGDDYWTIVDGVPVQAPRPPYTITDNEGHVYNTVYASGNCWTAENLRSTEYSDGTPIDGTYKYYSPMYPDSNANADIFGLLYNWEAAARPFSGTVQGACPAGWRLPTEDDYSALNMHPILDLRSPNYWLVPGTNLTGFTALPAGMYDGLTNSFYHLMGDTYFWSTAGDSLQRKSSHISFSCDEVQIIDVSGGVGLSIRCVKE